MTRYACLLVVTEPMNDDELLTLARSGDTSGKAFASVMIHEDYLDAAERGLTARRVIARDALAELGVEAYGYDEYGWKEA